MRWDDEWRTVLCFCDGGVWLWCGFLFGGGGGGGGVGGVWGGGMGGMGGMGWVGVVGVWDDGVVVVVFRLMNECLLTEYLNGKSVGI